MDNCDVTNHLLEHDYGRVRRVSARRAEAVRKTGSSCRQCPCCRDVQPKLQPSAAAAASRPQKRKRTSVARPSKASSTGDDPLSPQPSTQEAADIPGSLDLVRRPQSPISPADLPVASNVAPGPQPSTAALHHDDRPLKIHNRSVEEYQKIYHDVVDDMLKYKSGRPRPYSLDLGRRIKQKLWERLQRPVFTESVDEDGRVHVDVAYGSSGDCPPSYDVDVSAEPSPKRAKSPSS